MVVTDTMEDTVNTTAELFRSNDATRTWRERGSSPFYLRGLPTWRWPTALGSGRHRFASVT